MGTGFKRNPSAPLPCHFVGLCFGEALVCHLGAMKSASKPIQGPGGNCLPTERRVNPGVAAVRLVGHAESQGSEEAKERG
jgi:hypothetical protein